LSIAVHKVQEIFNAPPSVQLYHLLVFNWLHSVDKITIM